MLPFKHTIPRDEQDKDFGQRLEAERGGILAWAIQGCLEWLRVGLTPPECAIHATDEYMEEEDRVGRWIGSNCTPAGDDTNTLMSALWADWKEWCESNEERTRRQREFSQELASHGFPNLPCDEAGAVPASG